MLSMWRGKGTERYGKRKDLAAMRPGEHAYPPRTRELRPGRPMVLCLGMGEQEAARFFKKEESKRKEETTEGRRAYSSAG